MAKSIADSLGRRRHDRTMIEQGAVLGFRLNEPESAECYFCDGIGVIDSEEHILPQWLCAELGMTEQSFHSRNMSQGQVLFDRSRIPARNFVAKSICRNCNNGWMSQAEASFQPFIRGGRDAASLDVIARWFAKTAFVLNVSQPVRLLVPRQLRLGLAAGTFGERLSLYFHRTEEPARSDWRFDCFQGSLIAWMSPDKNKIAEMWDSVKQVWACSIRIDDIVGTVVVSPPDESWGSSWSAPGSAAVIDGALKSNFRWQDLPSVRHFEHAAFMVPRQVGWTKNLTPVEPFPSLGGIDSINTYLDVMSKEYPQHPPVGVADRFR